MTAGHADVAALLGVYALHALEPDEAARVEAHVRECDECRAELDRHHEIAAAIGDSAVTIEDDGELPAEVVDSIWASVRGTRQATVLAFDAAREDRRHRVRRRVGAAVAAVAVAGAVSVPALVRSNGAPTLAALARRAETADGSRLAVLRDGSGRSVAKVVMTRSGAGYLVATGLDELAADRAYQLWAVGAAGSEGAPISAGVLGPAPSVVAFTVSSSAPTYALSVEPVSGSTAPTSTPVATGTLV